MAFRDIERITVDIFEKSFTHVRRQFERLKKRAVEHRENNNDQFATISIERKSAAKSKPTRVQKPRKSAKQLTGGAKTLGTRDAKARVQAESRVRGRKEVVQLSGSQRSIAKSREMLREYIHDDDVRVNSIDDASTFNFLDADNLNEKLSVSMHEIQTQNLSIHAVPVRKSSLGRKSALYNVLQENSSLKRRRATVVKKVVNIDVVDILLEMSIRKMNFSDIKSSSVHKCGEATFSEVFDIDGLIYKIVPIGDTDEYTDMDTFFRESYIFNKVSGEQGVCELKGVFVVTGRYPKVFLDAWDDYKRKFGSESERPAKYKATQKYGVLVMENTGIDLEKYVFRSKTDIKLFLRQFIECVASLEQKYAFEHRDLHWGNIMIRDDNGLQMRIIDFSLSRLHSESLVYTDLSRKLWIFEGDEKVDEQFGIYRQMRDMCGNDWSLFMPMSNILWIRYVVNKIEGKSMQFSLKVFLRSLKLELSKSTNTVDLLKGIEALW